MKCIPKDKIFESEIIIKKSKFITSLKYITSKEQAKDFIEEIKSKNPNAAHNCSAFICGQIMLRDDDGEPTKTAGEPMLNVLIHHDLNNVCAVVTRYFGGIKLGAGGLVRAYSKSVSESILSIDLISLEKGYKCSISFDYKHVKVIDYFFKSQDIKICSKEFARKITYEFEILQTNLEDFKIQLESIDHTIKTLIIEQIYINTGK